VLRCFAERHSSRHAVFVWFPSLKRVWRLLPYFSNAQMTIIRPFRKKELAQAAKLYLVNMFAQVPCVGVAVHAVVAVQGGQHSLQQRGCWHAGRKAGGVVGQPSLPHALSAGRPSERASFWPALRKHHLGKPSRRCLSARTLRWRVSLWCGQTMAPKKSSPCVQRCMTVLLGCTSSARWSRKNTSMALRWAISASALSANNTKSST
jgi:hypothetical protein